MGQIFTGAGHEVNRFFDGGINQMGEGIAGDCAQQVSRHVLVGRKAGQGAVEVDVGDVDEFQIEFPVMTSHSSQLVQIAA